MKPVTILMGLAAGFSVIASQASASCFPVKTEIVSLGEISARAYAERSLDKGIEDQRLAIEASGAQIGQVTKPDVTCQRFPNILGADEWRCVGAARVCSKS